MHTVMRNKDTSPERAFQKHLSDPTHAHGLIDHGKYSKQASNNKWMDCEYHVQDNKDIQQKSVKNHVLQRIFMHFHLVVHMKNPME